jgi:hypothetical protein
VLERLGLARTLRWSQRLGALMNLINVFAIDERLLKATVFIDSFRHGDVCASLIPILTLMYFALLFIDRVVNVMLLRLRGRVCVCVCVWCARMCKRASVRSHLHVPRMCCCWVCLIADCV